MIELLTSFTVLSVIVVILAIALNALTENWRETQAQIRVFSQGRAVIETVAQDLRQAVALSNFPITLDNAMESYDATNHAIQFVRLLPSAPTNQYAVEAVRFGVFSSNGTFRLARWLQPLTLDPANPLPAAWNDDNLSFSNAPPYTLADGLAAFQIHPASVVSATNSLPNDVVIPPYFDVYLELLGEDHARTAAALSGTNQILFVERHVQRFAQRVFLPAVNRWNLP